MNLRFGYFDSDVTLRVNDFTISPIEDFDHDQVRSLADEDGWIFAPSMRSRIFGLPLNYQLEGEFDSEEHAKFIIWCLSFVYGVKLSTLPREFLDATNIRLNQSFGFVFMKKSDIEYTLQRCCEQYRVNIDEQNKRICAIIHLLFMSRNKFYLNFESFSQLYMAIDCCYKFVNVKYGVIANKHAERISRLAEWAGIELPDGFSGIPDARNNLFHEGIYVDELLGYAHFDYNLLFVNNFICKVLFKILEINDQKYISQSRCETRCTIGINLQNQ